MQYVIYVGSTTDGKVYKQIVCDCGMQTSGGTCPHVSNPLIVEDMNGFPIRPKVGIQDGVRFFDIK
jgi:hypothetical protein